MPLITPAQLRAGGYIPGITGSDMDTPLAALIEVADQLLAAHCRLPLPSTGGERTLCSSTYVLYLDGPGGDELRLPLVAVTAITSIYDDPDRAYSSTYLVDSGDYTLFGDEGLVLLDTDSVHGAWSSSRRALKVTCTAGYTASTLPDNVRHACGMLVAELYRRDIPEIGAKAEDVRTAKTVPLPLAVKAAIGPLRQLTGIAA